MYTAALTVCAIILLTWHRYLTRLKDRARELPEYIELLELHEWFPDVVSGPYDIATVFFSVQLMVCLILHL